LFPTALQPQSPLPFTGKKMSIFAQGDVWSRDDPPSFDFRRDPPRRVRPSANKTARSAFIRLRHGGRVGVASKGLRWASNGVS